MQKKHSSFPNPLSLSLSHTRARTPSLLHAAPIKPHVASAAFLASRHAQKDALALFFWAIISAAFCGLPHLPKASYGDQKGWAHVGAFPGEAHSFLTFPRASQHVAVFCTLFHELILGIASLISSLKVSAVVPAMANAPVDDGSFRMSSDSLACAGMSSRSSLLSKIDSVGHLAPQSSLLRDNGMLLKLGHSVEKSSGEQADAKPKQGALMRKLSWLISPKKKQPKSSARKRSPLSMQEGGGDGKDQLGGERKDHLELLFAQAEATLGELLVKAGASFNARSSLQQDYHPHPHHHQHHHESSRSNGGSDSTSLRLGGSFGRSGAVAGQGHVKRNSLSRVWQQLGGSLFCGSGHMNALLVEEMELRGVAPIPQTPSATYFGDGADEDMVADESYWQSLAENILMQRQKTTDVDRQAIVDHPDEQNELSMKEQTVETSHDSSVTSVSASQHMHIAGREPEAESLVSEIMSVSLDDDVLGRQEDARWAACGMTECSLEDSHNRLLVPSEFGHGCARLNTTLDASPNLAHNYQMHIKSRTDSGGVGSSSKNVVDLLNYYSRPLPVSASDQIVEPILAQAAASCSSAVCGSSSNVEATLHSSEDFLLHACGRLSEPNETNLESPTNAAASDMAATSIDSRAQKQPESATNSARVSLMALLHEEAAAVESVDTRDMIEDVGRAQAVVPQEEERLVGEEPLALFCCVCMVRRKGAALIPCGHTFCRICSKQLFAGRGACPLCNNLIVQLLDIF